MGLTAPRWAKLRRFAFARPRAFPVLGWGGTNLWHTFLDTAPVDLSRAPHDADLLVLAGEIPESWVNCLLALFETLTLPRLALWLQPGWPCTAPAKIPLGFTMAHGTLADTDWTAVSERLIDPQNPASTPLLPDEPPAPWRGQGDHGQGGKGMMGGKPYGRPMAMTMEDRDNLALDDVPTFLGPHFPGLPSGLELELRLQGDRIRQCQGLHNGFPERPFEPEAIRYGGSGNAPALQALTGKPVTVAELERARLAHHLGWMADFLELAGLHGLAEGLRRHRNSTDEKVIEDLLTAAQGITLRRLGQGIGIIDRDGALRWNLRGPVARASGVAVDARSEDPAYRDLGFAIHTETAGDVWARFRVRTEECRQSIRLLKRAGDAMTSAPEGPRGGFIKEQNGLTTPTAANLTALNEGLTGLEWYEAVLFIVSLDLDMEEAALR